MNKVFLDTALGFNGVPLPDESTETPQGATIAADGGVGFVIAAPHTDQVVLRVHGTDLPLVRDPSGIHTGTLPFDPSRTGPLTVDVLLDSDLVLSPFLPVYWTANRPANYVEVPDPDGDYLLIRDVPHGTVSTELYWSAVMADWQRAVIYTPPGYAHSPERLPVLYLLNGGGDNEIAWTFTGRIAHIYDNLLADGLAEPAIVVMNNGMLRHGQHISSVVDDAFERMLIEDCIPFVERTRPVRTDRWSRAIAGLSMGAYMSNDIGLAHPELFGSIGQFTASMTHETLEMTYDRPYQRVMVPGTDLPDRYRVFFRSTTPNEDHFDYFEADDVLCAAAGLEGSPGYHRVVYPLHTSKWNSWRRGVHDFARLVFRQ